MIKKQIRTLLRCSRRANWNGILSALLIASLLLPLGGVVLHGAQAAHSELARDSAFEAELPAGAVPELASTAGEHWMAENAPVPSVNWGGPPIVL